MRRLLFPSLAVLLVLPGCDSTGADRGALTLSVPAASFAAGADVSGAVANRTTRPLYLYQCGGRVVLEVQERDGGSWQTTGFVNGLCTDNLDQTPLRFDEGERQDVSFVIRSPGEYRLLATYGSAADFDTYTETTASEPFEVRAP